MYIYSLCHKDIEKGISVTAPILLFACQKELFTIDIIS